MTASTRYHETARELFGAAAGSGYSEADVVAAEARLGRPLPAALRAHYLTFGKHRYNRAHDRLLAPDALRIERGMLFFYEENQAVFHWAVPADDPSDDPPVLQAVDDSHEEWNEDHDRLSQFLTTMLFHHRARMTPCAHGRAAHGAIVLPAIELPGCRRPIVSFHRAEGVVVEIDNLNEDGRVRVLAGAREEEALRAFQRTAPVEWT
jgi:hypothetical protein